MSDLINKEDLVKAFDCLDLCHNDLIGRQEAYKVLTDYYHHNTETQHKALREALDRVPSVQDDWIPCSERLPNCNGCYLVWRPHFFGGEKGMPAICYFDGQNTWHDSYGVDFERVLHPDDVIAWMPLPEPYKAGDSE